MKKIVLLFLFFLIARICSAQELQAKLTVLFSKISTQADRKRLIRYRGALSTFLNSRKWTSDSYQPQEKVKCNFLVTLDQDLGQNVYKASLTVQAARPVYNSTYESPLVNFQDNDLVFRYVEFQPIEFNENRVQGSDPLAANLTAVLAYYVNIILGLDYDSFLQGGGEPYYQKALNIVNNAPEGRDISGWKTFDGIRNRYRLIENLTDNRFNLIHDVVYSYYRQGMDLLYENEEAARTGVLNSLRSLNSLNQEFPNAMILQFFFGGKSSELVNIFGKAPANVKAQARELLSRLDVTNAAAYKELK